MKKGDGELLDALIELNRWGLLFPRYMEGGFDRLHERRLQWLFDYQDRITSGEFASVHFVTKSSGFHAGAMKVVSERGGRAWMFDASGSHFREIKQRFFFDPDQENDQRLYVCGFIPLSGGGE